MDIQPRRTAPLGNDRQTREGEAPAWEGEAPAKPPMDMQPRQAAPLGNDRQTRDGEAPAGEGEAPAEPPMCARWVLIAPMGRSWALATHFPTPACRRFFTLKAFRSIAQGWPRRADYPGFLETPPGGTLSRVLQIVTFRSVVVLLATIAMVYALRRAHSYLGGAAASR